MAQVFLSEKESGAIVCILEEYIFQNPTSETAKIIVKAPERIRNCVAMQGRKSRQRKANGKQSR